MTNEPSSPPLILVADDEKFIRLQLKYMMEKEGYQVEEVEDGSQCIEAFIRLHPDIVLLDAKMPVMDGFTCCAKLQTLPEFDQTPILMITSLDDQQSVDLAFQAGAADYVTKPIHFAVLRQRVRRLLQQRIQSRQIALLMAKLQQANQELERLVSIDGLTQVANRRHFDQYLEQQWLKLTQEQAPLSLILCDIDFFKCYNDTYGHQAGDDCLRTAAQVMSQAVKRPGNMVARYGGEEFAIILPNTTLEEATQIAQSIREAVAALQVPHSGSKGYQYLTLSLGVASTIPQAANAANSLIAEADQALYQAKAEGRNRVV